VNHVSRRRHTVAGMRRLLLRQVLVVMLPLLLVQAGIYTAWHHSRAKEEQNRLAEEQNANLEMARAAAAMFDADIDDVRRQEWAIGLALAGLHPYTIAQANNLLAENARVYPAVRTWNWVDPNGKIVASNDSRAVGLDISGRADFQKARSGQPWAVSNLLTDQVKQDRVFYVAHRIEGDRNGLLGVVTATVRADLINSDLAMLRRGAEGAITIFDATGGLAYSSDPDVTPYEDRRTIDPLLAAALDKHSEQCGIIELPDGNQQCLAARVPIGNLGWVAGACRSTHATMSSVYRGLWIVAGLNLLVAFASGALAAKTGGRLIAEVRQLQKHAQAIGRGDFGHVPEIKGVSELADLAATFNQMGTAVRTSQEALEQANATLENRVHERTAQLAASINNLERSEREVRAASLYARSLIEASLDPLLTISPDGKITDVNEATEAATGIPRNQLVGSDFSDYFTQPELAGNGYRKVLAEGLVRDYPLTIRHVSGRTIDVLYNAVVYKNDAGNVQGVFAAARDVTERKRAEEQVRRTTEALETERRRFHEVLDMLPAYVALLTPDYHVPYANRFFEQRFGQSQGRRCYEYLFGRSQPCENCETYKVLKTGLPQRWEWTGPDGRNYDVSDFPFTDADGSPLIMEMGIDVTERKQAEAELEKYRHHLEELVEQRTAQLEAANAQLQALFDVANVGILLLDESGVVTRVNRTLTRWVGKDLTASGDLQPGDVVGCVHALAAPQGCGTTERCRGCPIRNAFESVLKTGRPVHDVETETVISAGGVEHRLWLEVSADPVVLGGNRNVILAMNNVTARKRAEAENLRLASFPRLNPNPVTEVDLAGRVCYVNPAAERFFPDLQQSGLAHPWLAGWESVAVEPQSGDQPVSARELIVGERWYRQTIHHVKEIGRVRLYGFDITDRKRAEEALRDAAERLARSNEELEQFASVASHDLQEPLRVVTGYVQLLERKYKSSLDADAELFIDYIVDAVARMQQLINDLLDYSRVGTRDVNLRSLDMRVVVDVALTNLKTVIEETGAAVTCDPLPTIEGDETQLVRLLQNLIGNGIKFRGDRPPQIHVSARRDGDGWQFAVRDNGIGIEKQYFEQIFVIFQRLHTRQEYAGTGIGLAICKRIVERHGGRIWLDSEPGQGTTFFFTLSQPRRKPHDRHPHRASAG
jgi:PAS domain S-box-containing protein